MYSISCFLHVTRNKKLLGAPGLTRTLLGAPGIATRSILTRSNKKPLGMLLLFPGRKAKAFTELESPRVSFWSRAV